MEIHKSQRVYDFMSIRRYMITLSIALTVISAVLVWKPGPKYGIDFLGGTELTVRFNGRVEPGAIRRVLQSMGNERPEVVPTRTPNEYIIRIEKTSTITPAARDRIRTALAGRLAQDPTVNGTLSELNLSPGGDHLIVQVAGGTLDGRGLMQHVRDSGADVRGEAALQIGSRDDHRWQVPLRGVGDNVFHRLIGPTASGGLGVGGTLSASVWVSPKAGKELRSAAIYAVLYSIVFIMIYIAFRFDLRFAPGGILALIHDALVTLGFFVITRKEVTISTVAAILTVVGYSMNDTVIVYDRIRENLAKRKGIRMIEIINVSVSEMLSRTVLTSLTVVLSISMFAIIGTGVIADFAWAMIVGVIAGTYSSIYVAAPLTEWIDSRFFHTEQAVGITSTVVPAGSETSTRA